MNPIDFNTIKTPNLNLGQRSQLLLSIATVLADNGKVEVALTYVKQTDTKPRIEGEDYVGLPGVSTECQIGPLSVDRYVDNADNRRQRRVGRVYLQVESVTRADGVNPRGYTRMRPEGITAFQIRGFRPNLAKAPARVGV